MTNDLLGGYVVVYPPKKKFPLVKNQNFSPRNFPPNSFLKKIHFPKVHAYKFLKFVPNLQNFSSWQTFPLHSLVTCSVSPTKIFRKTFRVKYSIIYFFQKLLCKAFPLDSLFVTLERVTYYPFFQKVVCKDVPSLTSLNIFSFEF